MSDYRAVAAMTETLRTILHQAIQVFPGAEVETVRPKREAPEHKQGLINIFLYQVEPNPAWRNMELPVRDPEGRLLSPPQAALDLHYLISFYGDDELQIPQLLLGKTVSTLHAFPYPPLRAMPRPRRDTGSSEDDVEEIYKLWESGLADQIHLLQFVPMSLSHDELSKLWTIFFQVPYALSVVYRCSVILIQPEGEIVQPRAPALPVRRVLLKGVSVELPEISQVNPQVLEFRPGARILLKGRNLDAATTVLLGGLEAPVRLATAGSMLVDLPPGLAAGVVTVQAVRDVALGRPPTAHRLYESSPASFVLRPRIVSPPVYRPPEVEAAGEGREGKPQVVVQLAPAVRAGQRTSLLLNPLDAPDGGAPASYAFPGRPGAAGETLAFAAAGVEAGTYLVRVQVDGVSTALEVDHDPQSPTFEEYTAPRVTVP